MKIFRRKNGREAGKTLTVSELKKELDKYPDETPVMATWEGVTAYIDPDNFSQDVVTKGLDEDVQLCLIIDVNEY